ncbi:universal stress protein [Actinokineospora sp. PR83]|uniref:universal stress protein n=1 Tax=Actinokineospora sp. PR83 TaxID=2884908 RepID=UPI001F1FD67E|nr:universal stress protein [Actinokineospora sp. PR83]MCG8917491.1 universal stress protein [Actinokineospora sp. PR83]
MTIHTATMLAAVDGSESSTRALRWAAREAGRRHCALRVVTVHPWPVTGYPEALVAAGQLHDGLRTQSREILRAAQAVAAETAPEVPVSTEVLEGDVVPRLRAAAADAVLTVLGSRGLGGFSGLLLGSVAVGLAAHATHPVVVVRGDERDEDRRVVAGVDGSAADEAVLGFAFAHAAATGGVLTVAHAWGDFAVDGLRLGAYPPMDWTPVAEYAEHVVSTAVAPWRDKYPAVTVEKVVSRGWPAALLLERSHHAGLVVVGSRGRGNLAGLLLGSTSHALIHHCACPVAVVRPDTTTDQEVHP